LRDLDRGRIVLAMAIKRSGPPTTHDSVTWRVPLSEPPSSEWQQSFQTADDSGTVASSRRVQFEDVALTFRSREEHVPVWVELIDKWIAHANTVQAGLDHGRRGEAARAQQESDTRRQRANEANEKFKNL
jgi:hypothetical protein